MIDRQMAGGGWAMGDTFGLADCSAFPALFYGNKVEPFGAAHRKVTEYLDRLSARPSIARVVKEAEPYFKLFPQ
jgi:glutathione S-transferase